MKKDILNLKSTLPVMNKPYDSLDILGKTVGRYFDYKKETAMIEHETKKVKEQSKIILKKIDAELQVSLDNNDKSFQKEMFRLQSIAEDLKSNNRSKKEIFKNISKCMKMLESTTISDVIKETIPQLISEYHKALSEENSQSMQKLNLMQGFDPDTKLIEGE